MERLLNSNKDTISNANERLHFCLEKVTQAGFPLPSTDDLKEVCLTRSPSKWEITKDEIPIPPSYLLFGIVNFCDGFAPTSPEMVLKKATERRELLLIVSEFFPKSSCLSNTFRERGVVLKKEKRKKTRQAKSVCSNLAAFECPYCLCGYCCPSCPCH